jgi:hypothetical protein
MKEYMFFIRKQDNSRDTLPPDRLQQFLKACEKYIENLKQQGKLLSAQPIDWTGKIISRKTGDWRETSYNEPGEVIGGYYHILADNLDEAIKIAKENPEFLFNENTRIEVRPVKMEEEKTGFIYPSESASGVKTR